MSQVTITVQTRDRYNTTGEMEEDNQRIGHSWFDAGNRRAFRSRTLDTVYGGHYFVSSEQSLCKPRKYTVRSCFDGRIDTVGEFQAYATAEQAKRAARKVAQS